MNKPNRNIPILYIHMINDYSKKYLKYKAKYLRGLLLGLTKEKTITLQMKKKITETQYKEQSRPDYTYLTNITNNEIWYVFKPNTLCPQNFG